MSGKGAVDPSESTLEAKPTISAVPNMRRPVIDVSKISDIDFASGNLAKWELWKETFENSIPNEHQDALIEDKPTEASLL